VKFDGRANTRTNDPGMVPALAESQRLLMQTKMITVFIACIGLAGACSTAGAQMFSATRPVIAIVAGDLFTGDAEGHLNGSGTLSIHSHKDPALVCHGQFTSTAAHGGDGELQCTNGSVATFHFTRLTAFTGHGSGSFGSGTMSFAYGLGHAEATPYLHLPEGKKLTQSGNELAMADQ
jgi:hypothetical protein